MIKRLVNLIPRKVFRYGSGHVTRYTLFECKSVASVYVHHIATDVQDRFHTHAFNSVSFVFRGGYTEVVKEGFDIDSKLSCHAYSAPALRYIPRLLNHKLLIAEPGTLSLIVTGSYADMWTEELDDGTFRLIGSGQRDLLKVKMSASKQS